jgi:hypothetical protein
VTQAEIERRLVEMANKVNSQRQLIEMTSLLESSVRSIYGYKSGDPIRAAKDTLAEHLHNQIVEAELTWKDAVIHEAEEICKYIAEIEAYLEEKENIIEDMHRAMSQEVDINEKLEFEVQGLRHQLNPEGR